jgi:MFS family permease
MSHPASFPSWFVIKLTALASLGGCLFGYDMGAIAGALPQLTQQYALASNQQGWVVSILYLGGGVGALIGGTICDRMGRLTTILMTDILFIVGAGWFFWVADSFVGLLIGRFLVGIAIAISGIADVAYLQEIAPQAWRGAIVSVNEACISLGFLYAYLAGYVYSDGEVEDWRKIFGLAGLLALVQGIGMWSMPESPVWLAGQGRIEQSEKVYQILRSSARSRGESIKDDDDYGGDSLTKPSNPRASLQTVAASPSLSSYQVSGSRNNGHDFRSYESLESFIGGDTGSKSFRIYSFRATISRYYRQAWIALFLAVTQQFCGQAVVLNYAPAILGASPNWSTLAMGGLKFLVTVIVVLKIEAIGRRFLLLCGMGLIALGLLALSVSTSSLVLPGVLAVVGGYSMSFGPLTWLLTAEFFPSEIRGRALGLSTIVTYTSAAVVTRTFLPMSEWLGYSFVFGGYAVITIVGMIFAYSAIPETGDRSLEQIEATLDDTRFWGCGKKMNEESTTTTFELSASQPSPLDRLPQRSSRFVV